MSSLTYPRSTMGAPHRRTIYIASLEAHIDRLHAQLLSMGLYPIPFDKLEPYRGLNSKTAKVRTSPSLVPVYSEISSGRVWSRGCRTMPRTRNLNCLNWRGRQVDFRISFLIISADFFIQSSSLRDILGAPQVRRHSVDSSRPY